MTPYFDDPWLTVYQGDCRAVLETLPSESVHCVVTSPPYWGLRDYGTEGQLGLEPTPEQYVESMVAVFREVRRVLRNDGTLWLNLGDSYAAGKMGRDDEGPADLARRAAAYGTGIPKAAVKGANGVPRQAPDGLKPKDLVGIPWRVAFALQADGWYLRSDIIWSKPNPMPESVTDRPTKSHEYLFLLSKSERYYFDADAVRESYGPNAEAKLVASRASQMRHTQAAEGIILGRKTEPNGGLYKQEVNPAGRNIRSVWTIATQPYPGAHFATFPPKLVEPCIKAGCPELGTILDPFAGSGTAGMVAQQLSRRAILIDLNADYLVQCLRRNAQTPLGLTG